MLPLIDIPERIGRYEILSELGRGSMGHVYLAFDPNIQRKIALKLFLPLLKVSRREESGLRQRFILEARAAGRLKHPGVVTVFDADTDADSGLSFIAMEWVDGPSLQELIRENGPLDTARAVSIVEQIAIALDAAHREGLVHRDIKPANILLDREGRAKVTDFGIAKLASMSITGTDWIPGSPFYMSPEQVRNHGIDGRSDLYSLGVVLYQCLTGQVPFEGDSLASITYMILEIDPRPPQAINPKISSELAAVVERALRKNVGERYQTGLELAFDLRATAPLPAGVHPSLSHDTGSHPILHAVAPAAANGSAANPTLLLAAEPQGAVDPRSPSGQDRRALEISRLVWRSVSRRPWRTAAALSVLILLLFVVTLPARAPEPEPEYLTVSISADSPAFEPELNLPAVPPPVPADESEPQAEVTRPTRPLWTPRTPRRPRTRPAASEAVVEAETTAEPEAEAAPADAAAPPAADAGFDSLPTPEPAVIPEPEEMATLEVVYRNRLKAGSVSVWVDEVKIWSQDVSAPANFFKRTAVGRTVWTQLELPAGHHVIDVRVSGPKGKVDAVKRVEAGFAEGETKRLRVSLLPPKFLRLSWKAGDRG